MSFLAKLSQLKKPSVNANKVNLDAGRNQKRDVAVDPLGLESRLLPQEYVRQEDPAVRRLKELRRQEQIKNAAKSGKKAPPPPTNRKKKEPAANTETRFRRKPGDSKKSTVSVKPTVRAPIKKLSFEELMKQADERAKSPAPNAVPVPDNATASFSAGRSKGQKLPGDKLKSTAKKFKARTNVSRPLNNQRSVPRLQPLGVPASSLAQPNPRLRHKLNALKHRRQKGSSDEGEDMDDFIEDDEAGEDYNRDEIWAMFNKGKRRRDFESEDESDMEANEMEILEEEEHATRMARLEDKKEEQWLKKHEEQKRKKLEKF
ncbi:LADA_0F04236g1_1 [Lachancea dasiensis]|uniref:LADA_0F04236g1_1 n=1 Tax=Lachancea dasiensis TaxID=1072105 RepID=A0A1G4JJ05_9SACH|nr:LADA_0F04236g1_1 [Lachancea dasiensis]